MTNKYYYSRIFSRARIPLYAIQPQTSAEETQIKVEDIQDLIKVRIRPPAINTTTTYAINTNIQPVIVIQP